MRANGGGGQVASRAARARAEQLWRETVAQPSAPSNDGNGSNDPHLFPSLSAPEGQRGGVDGMARTSSPPRGKERDGKRWGRITSREPGHPPHWTTSCSPLPSGPVTRKLRALWISAFDLGLIRDRSDDALVAWLRRQQILDAETCRSVDSLASAIQPLETWLARAAGVDWRPHLSLGRCGQVREVRRPRARVLEAQWRLLYRQGRVRIGSHAALGAYAARFAGLGRADSHLGLSDAQADALIRHLGKCIRAASGADRPSPRAVGRA